MRSRRPPPRSAYYSTTAEIFRLESEVLTAFLPHSGERGANDEERCRAFLSRVLPRRYSIGTGFVVCSEPDATASPQQDIIIYDDFLNSPLHRELTAAVFPIEMVYGTVEVKGRLDHQAIRSSVESIGATRQLSMQCYYERHFDVHDDVARSNTDIKWQTKKPPRAFVFAYDSPITSLDTFQSAWEDEIAKVGTAHLHARPCRP